MANKYSAYLDFDLLIERHGESYHARVIDSPAGQAKSDFTLPFREEELRTFFWLPGHVYRHLRLSPADETATSALNPRHFGTRLFKAVFSEEIRTCLMRSLDEAERAQTGLRIRLRLDSEVQELADLPWECLYIPDASRFLALSAQTPVVRYIELPLREDPLQVAPPLHILAVAANPSDVPPLNVEQEWERLQNAVADLQTRKLITIERLEENTLSALQRRLRKGDVHIFHFIGHGRFDPEMKTGALAFEDDTGKAHLVSSEVLGTLFHDHRPLRLVFLNACEGARTDRADSFAGVAQHLVQQGVPAVIAMQFEVTDKAAVALSHEFYQALADGYPVDAALTEARKIVFGAGNGFEWGTPVLFMRTDDGRLFDFQKTTGQAERQPTELLQRLFQAPHQIPHFTGRRDLVSQLTTMLTQSAGPSIVGLVGLGGAGKTALAIHIAHSLQGAFPDGVLWANLATSSVEAELVSFVADFGQAKAIGERVDLVNKAEFMRGVLANKHLLVVIDNAEERTQIETLLPGGAQNRVLITTRNRKVLSDLGAKIVDIASFSEAEARDFLCRTIGETRAQAEPEAARSIPRRVGGLPLALSIVAGYLNEAIELTLAQFDELLQDERTRLETLTDPEAVDRNVNATFELSYRRLPAATQKLFASLALFEGPDFGSEAVAAINHLPLPKVILDLGRLSSLSLVQTGAGERETLLPLELKDTTRYRLHALVKAFASVQLGDDRQNLQRILASYFTTLAEKCREPKSYPALDLEWQNIMRALQWAHDQNEWSILVKGALGLTHNNLGQMGFMDARGYWSDARRALAWASEGVDCLDDSFAKVRILTNLGGFAVRQSEFDNALSALATAGRLLESMPASAEKSLQQLYICDFMARALQTTDRKAALRQLEEGISKSGTDDTKEVQQQNGYLYTQMAAMYVRMGAIRKGIEAAEKGLALLPQAPSTARVVGLLNLGIGYESLGQAEESMKYLHEGIPLAEVLGDVARLAALWLNMGLVERRIGHTQSAIEYLKRAQHLYQRMGDVYHDSGANLNIGYCYVRLGDDQQALTYLNRSITLSEEHEFSDIEALAKCNLAELYLLTDQVDATHALLLRARTLCDEVDMGFLLPTALRLQAEVDLLQGALQQGLDHIEQSLTLAHENEDMEEEGIGWRVKGNLYNAEGKAVEALCGWQQSLAVLADQDPYELARTKLAIAEGALTASDGLTARDQVQRWLQEALGVFTALSAVRDLSKAQQIAATWTDRLATQKPS